MHMLVPTGSLLQGAFLVLMFDSVLLSCWLVQPVTAAPCVVAHVAQVCACHRTGYPNIVTPCKQVVVGVEPAAAADCTARLCRCVGVLWELSCMLAEWEKYSPVRHSPAHMFADFGGWAEFICEGLIANQFTKFMHQFQHQVAAFLHECS